MARMMEEATALAPPAAVAPPAPFLPSAVSRELTSALLLPVLVYVVSRLAASGIGQ
jgi:hypothetical protein